MKSITSQPPRVTCIVKRFEHHTASGGYDRLASAVGADLIGRKRSAEIFSKVIFGVWRRLTPNNTHYSDYQVGDWLNELQALAICVLRPPDILHVLYSSQLYLLPKWRSLLRCRLVVTFHAPFDNVGRHRFDGGLNIDAAVVVATSQIVPMQRWLASSKITYVPHGMIPNVLLRTEINWTRTKCK